MPPFVELAIAVRCFSCGVPRDLPLNAEDATPATSSRRALRTDEALYLETDEPCACGARHVKATIETDAAE